MTAPSGPKRLKIKCCSGFYEHSDEHPDFIKTRNFLTNHELLTSESETQSYLFRPRLTICRIFSLALCRTDSSPSEPLPPFQKLLHKRRPQYKAGTSRLSHSQRNRLVYRRYAVYNPARVSVTLLSFVSSQPHLQDANTLPQTRREQPPNTVPSSPFIFQSQLAMC